VTLRVMDLFSGIGGLSLGLKQAGGFRTVAYCEIDPYCRKVLQARMRDGALDTAPICTDIRRLDGVPWRGHVDLICGGFPCQDVSNAGLRAGIEGERSGLWGEMYRLVCEVRPSFVFVENVSALLIRGFDRVLGELAKGGYDAEWICLRASQFGGYHERERVWIVAYRPGQHGAAHDLLGESAAWGPQIESGRLHRLAVAVRGKQPGARLDGEPRLVRLVHGVPDRVDRTKAAGNCVYPAVAEWIGKRIGEMNKS
jgi:DNA (cytosine-5)-methyltransferase 1